MLKDNYQYSQEQTDLTVERCYTNVFNVNQIHKEQQRLFDYALHENVLYPQIKILDKKTVKLIYKGCHIQPTLFNSYFEKRIEGKRRRGNYFSYFTFKEKFEMALTLCDIFGTLKDNGVLLQYPSDDMILVDEETKQIYLDLMPASLPRTPESEKLERELNVKYYCLIPRILSRSKNVARNNLILAALIFKLFKGEDCIQWDTYSGYMKKLKKNEKNVKIKDDLPFNDMLLGDNFYDMLQHLFQKGAYNEPLVQKAPSVWKKELTRFCCPCGNGYFTENASKQKICCACRHSLIGWVEDVRNHKTLPLITPNTDYTVRNFLKTAKEDKVLFKMHERSNQDVREIAVFFDANDSVQIYEQKGSAEEMTAVAVTQRNTQGNFLQLNFASNDCKIVKINGEQYIFTII